MSEARRWWQNRRTSGGSSNATAETSARTRDSAAKGAPDPRGDGVVRCRRKGPGCCRCAGDGDETVATRSTRGRNASVDARSTGAHRCCGSVFNTTGPENTGDRRCDGTTPEPSTAKSTDREVRRRKRRYKPGLRRRRRKRIRTRPAGTAQLCRSPALEAALGSLRRSRGRRPSHPSGGWTKAVGAQVA